MDRSSPAASADLQLASDASAEGTPAWRIVLAGTPREVLARLMRGDPLAVRLAVASRLRSGCVLLDADRVHLRVIAQIARSAGRYRGRPAVDEWVDGHVLRTIADVIREDHEVARGRATDEKDASDAFTALAGPLRLDPRSMRKACASFNVLPLADRAAFFDLVLRSRPLDDLAKELGESATQIARRARRALDATLEAAREIVGAKESP